MSRRSLTSFGWWDYFWPSFTNPLVGSKYRPSIDGLRAIAVLSVVLYHAFPELFPGGFVGVDVFFVISGYLITGIITKHLDKGDFVFSDFWARRVRRIFPSLLTVVLVSGLFGWLYLMPDEFQSLKKHIRWGLVFSANINLYREIGYFDVLSDLKPFLHFWSLAIEEQFYLVWPALLWFAHRFKLRLVFFAIVLAILSFYSRYLGSTDASGAFYFPWTRFWELLLGGIFALSQFERRFVVISSYRIRSGISIASLLLIVIPIFVFDHSTPFPSFWTLIPLLGAVGLILGGEDAFVNRWLLRLRPMVFVGLISYPLYLWHWPLFSFARIILGNPSFGLMISLTLLSLALAYLTFRFVEKPLRVDSTPRIGVFHSPKAVSLLTVSLIFVGLSWDKVISINPRSTESSNALQSKDAFKPKPLKYCQKHFPIELCEIVRDDVEPSVVLIGDSHANHLFPGLVVKMPNENVLILGKSGTPPFLNSTSLRTEHSSLSSEIERVLSNSSVKVVVLGGFWANYLEENGAPVADRFYKNRIRDDLNPSESSQEKIFASGLRRTVEAIHARGKKVVILLDAPSLPFKLSRCSPRPGLAQLVSTSCTFPSSLTSSRDRSRPFIENLARELDYLIVIDTLPAVCPGGICSVFSKQGKWNYSDDHHLSEYGAKEAFKLLRFPDLN